jgi:hypothetical protein
MTDFILRALHLPWWVPFPVWYGLYFLVAFWHITNGYGQEYLGWRHPGRPGKIHTILYRFHTGLHIHPDRSYGDESYRSRAVGSRGTIYWHPHGRLFRFIRNNLAVFAVLTVAASMVSWPKETVVVITVAVISGFCGLIFLGVSKARKRAARRRPVSWPALAQTQRAKAVLQADATTVGARPKLEIEARPQLDGVPAATLAPLLAAQMDCSTAEVLNRLSLSPDGARLILADAFPALQRTRDIIEEIISSHNKGKVKFAWTTTEAPRTLVWSPIVEHILPTSVRFRDYLDKIQALGPREFGVGVEADRSMYVSTHNGDAGPWHCRFAGSGTGKSMGFLVKAAQVAHADPAADLYCVDTKQVSFEHLRDIPGIHVYDNPQSEMDKIWGVFYELCGIMRDRYTALREGRLTIADLNDIWVFGDEGNDLGGFLKSYYRNVIKGTAASPVIWGEAIGPLFRLGRQARMFGEFMFQDLTDKAMGNESLKMAFSVFGAAGFLPGQFTRTIGNPAPECLEGPGKILMCRSNKRTWVQGFFDDPNWLHEYALANRKGRKG